MRMVAIAVLALGVAGCASAPIQPPAGLQPMPVRIEHGHPNRVIDGLGWVIGIPNKLALWDRRADNHDISPETEDKLVQYMLENDLNDVLVRVNQYDPGGEWRRLARNKRIGAGWRYTIGTLNTLEYTLLPGRIMGTDWYNPFTNTIHLYSDIPALALAEAAYAKDVRHRDRPGGYAAVNELPIAGMWHKTVTTQEILDYTQTRGIEADQEEAYRILYPDYGANWGGQVASFVPYGHVFGRLAGAAVGHTANGVRSLVSPSAEPASDDPASDDPASDDPTSDDTAADDTAADAEEPVRLPTTY